MKAFTTFLAVVSIFLATVMISSASDIYSQIENEKKADPLSIGYLRQQVYQRSDLVVEEKLEESDDYEQYTVSYQSEGLKIYALLTMPTGDMPESGWPAIVLNHGDIPPDTYNAKEKYTYHERDFATQGYVVLKPDYRGHGESEGKAITTYATSDYTIDVLNAVATLRRYAKVDPERIGLWGHSTGGHITLRAMVVDPSIKAGVIWGGVVGSYEELLVKWPSYWEVTNQPQPRETQDDPRKDWRSYIVDTYGNPSENKERWEAISATTYVQDISGPLQLHHAENDTWVPVVLSERLQKRMEETNQYSQLYRYQSSDHNLTDYYDLAMERSIHFFDRFVK